MVTERCRPRLRKALTSASFLLCISALLLAGCGAGAGSGSSGNNIAVSITNKITSVQAGTPAIAFAATVQNDSSNSGVTWSLTASGAACAPMCGTLSAATAATVLYTPPISAPAVPNNQPTVTATSVAKTNKSDSDVFAISAALLVSITNKFSSVNTGFSPFVVNAIVQNDPTNSGVTWTLTANGTACTPAMMCGGLSGATSTSVTYTPPKSVPATQPILTAVSAHDSSKSDVDSFSVILAPISVSIGNKVSTVYAGNSPMFFSANIDNDPSGAGVTWTLSRNGSSCSPACGTISAGQFSTVYTPPSTVPASPSTTLTAVSNADGTKSDFDTFTIAVRPPVSLVITQVNSVLAGGSGVNFSANIQNDPSSTPSVNWTLTSGGAPCSPSCGSLTNIAAASATYMPPSGAFAPVQITATSTYDASKSASATFSVTSTVANNCGAAGGQESLLNGHYALLLEGFWGTGNGTPIALGASFTANGSGGITGGDEDVNDTISPQYLAVNSSGSLYTVGADHRGCLQLTNMGGTTTVFHFALGGIGSGVASKGRIVEFDDNSGNGAGDRGSGILRLQDVTAFSVGALKTQYAFGVAGWSETESQSLHLTVAGSFSNASGSVSNATFDENIGGTLFPEATGVTGTIGSISSTTGRGTATLNPSIFDWAIYVVNSSEFFLIGTDPTNFNPVSLGIGVATGNSFTAASLSGNYVMHATGNTNGSADASLQLLTMIAGGAQTGTLSGTVDSYGVGNGAQTTTLSGVTYNVDPISGRTTLGNPSDNLPILYLTTPTDGISAFVAGVGPDALFGVAEQQTSSTLAAGTYIFGTEEPADNTVPNRAGVETIAAGGAITGTFDQSNTSGLQTNQSVSATVSLGSNGTGNIGSNTVAMTSGSKLFSIDETGGTSGPAGIVVAEQ
jgi:hypothetical protein